MSILVAELTLPTAEAVRMNSDTLSVELSDGRTIAVPLAWYPRLLHGTARERTNWRLIGRGQGIHWKDLDEDVSVESLLAGRASQESQTSLQQWLSGRTRRAKRSPRRRPGRQGTPR